MKLSSLPKRPLVRMLDIETLLSDVQRGMLRVPVLAGGLRWRAQHIEQLFDSIMRGFPVGGLLLWERAAEQEQLVFGPLQVAAPAVPNALHIVDGQQRVTAIAGCLLHPQPNPTGDSHALWFNLVEPRFKVMGTAPSDRSWIPVRLLGDRRRLQSWARTVDLGDGTDELVDRAFQLEEAILRYELPASIVPHADEDMLRLIFRQTNSSGARLDENEVFQALKSPEPRSGNIELFARHRAKTLNAALFSLARVRGGLEESDRPSLRALLALA